MHDIPSPVVGIVGGGQLARMMVEAAPAIPLDVVVLAKPADESVAELGERRGLQMLMVDQIDGDGVRRLAEHVDVVTFDFEPPDLDPIVELEAAGHVVRPTSDTLRFADKAHQRTHLAAAGLPVPPFVVSHDIDEIALFAAEHGWPVVIKDAVGGYDGRGVNVVADRTAAEAVIARRTAADGSVATLVVEPALELEAEVAAIVVRGVDGTSVTYPLVDTLQGDGICQRVTVPSTLSPTLQARSIEVAEAVAEHIGSIGVLAVELFVVGDRVLVNEVAPRPHNSGHLTIEAAATSQFENHLRAVAGLPLGPATLTVAAAAMVNLIGGPAAEPAEVSDGNPGDQTGGHAFIHLYGKTPRPARKVGHVTAVAANGVAAGELADRVAEELT